MMKFLPALLIVLLLLTGCAAPLSPEAPPTGLTIQAAPDPEAPAAALEGYRRDALQCYPLKGMGSARIYPLGDGRLLVASSGEEATKVALLEGDPITVTAEGQLPFPLLPEETSVAAWGDGFSCFDYQRGETAVFSGSLEEQFRIPAPAGLMGSPLLSRDGELLFYCTQDTIRVLERTPGFSRILKQTDCTGLSLTALDAECSALTCQKASGELLLISTGTGETLFTLREGSQLETVRGSIYAAQEGAGIFGEPNGPLMALFPRYASADICFLPQKHTALSVTEIHNSGITLDYYELATGLRTASVSLAASERIQGGFVQWGNAVCFLGYDATAEKSVLYLWDPSASPTGDPAVYTSTYHPRESPDQEALKQCEAYARELENRYGIKLRIYTAAAAVQPENARLEYEHHAPQLLQTLQLLEHCLQQYPPGFLHTVADRFDSLSLCMVRSIRPNTGFDLPEDPEGLLFWEGNAAYIALEVGAGAEGALYHQLCLLIDTVVFNGSSAYDTWQTLNPTGFRYDYSYLANRGRNSTAYLQPSSRAFVDMSSMSFPREDRASIMEYAMLPGNEELFRSDTMQKKLQALSLGIREAFGLTKHEEDFLWEQYLLRNRK